LQWDLPELREAKVTSSDQLITFHTYVVEGWRQGDQMILKKSTKILPNTIMVKNWYKHIIFSVRK
jgi:uncharacterized protein YbaP (TraB family)